MNNLLKTAKLILILLLIFFQGSIVYSQACTTLGQTPATAFPVCGTTTFIQNTVPLCNTNDLFVPGCTGTGANYQNRNPFWYKFTCFASGTLSFVITPLAANEDYDWQLYDITGRNPNDVFTVQSIVVAANWSGSYGTTGASATGVAGIQCASDPAANAPRFARSPNLIVGHEYILLISHFTDSQSGYTLSFAGGSAVITDPNLPHLQKITPDCDGKTLTIRLNKKMRCNSLTAPGTEFSISPSLATVVSAVAANCSAAFDFDELIVTLSAPLPNGNYQLIISNGSDNNSILDFCDRNIPVGEQLPFQYASPQPILADSIGRIGCAPDKLLVYFPKKIKCSTVAADGSDFSITGPTTVNIAGAVGTNCVNDLSDIVTVNLSAPISTQGNYTLSLKPGTDGTTIIDGCGIQVPLQSLPFNTADTVNADFNIINNMGCRFDTLQCSHNGNNNVNTWNWTINNIASSTSQNTTAIFSATSNNVISLFVSNGVCSDSSSATIDLNNEVKADFTMLDEICPEDQLQVTNTSAGLIDNWAWSFDIAGTNGTKDPSPVRFNPPFNEEVLFTISLTASNTALGCSDMKIKQLKVLKNCFIAVPTGFTPNNDGLNDYFYPNNAVKAGNLDFKVFNRWGQLVFHSRSWKDKWDGKINGQPQQTGVYAWILSYTHHDTGEKIFQKGTTVLIR